MSREPAPPSTLVVDEEPVTRLLVKRALEGFGFASVLGSADGRAAQEVQRQHPDGLMLTVILMPPMGGLEVLRWGRVTTPGAIWIFFAGLEILDSAVAVEFLPKSPRKEEMEVSVRNVLVVALFEKPSMEPVLARIRASVPAAPQLIARGSGGDPVALCKRVLPTHEAVSALSERGHGEFKELIEWLRREKDGP